MRRFAVLALISALLTPAAVLADTRDDVAAGVYRCARIADDRQWLDCFYGAAQPMRSRLGLTPAPESQQMLSRPSAMPPGQVPQMAPAAPRPAIASAAPPASSNGFGLPHDSGSARETSRIAAFTFDRFGIFTVTLANGQVWQQSSSDSTKAGWRTDPARTTYNVVISEGILGTYDFKVIGMPGAYKVRRIK
jgi:hypothetical protein